MKRFANFFFLAIAIFTGGVGGPAAQAATTLGFGTEGAAFAATKAGVQAVASATVVGTVNHQGNLGKALEELGKPDTLRSIVASIVTSGLTEGLATQLEIPTTQLKTFGEHATYAGLKASISVPVQATLGGKTLGDALASGATTFAADTVGGFSATQIGKARLEGMDFVSHKLAHSLVGAVSGAILDPKNPAKGALSGALGSGVAETVAELTLNVPQLLENKERLRAQDLPSSTQVESARNLGILSAATAALLTRKDVNIATQTATSAIENNNLGVVKVLKAAAKGTIWLWQKGKKWVTKGATQEVREKTAKRTIEELQKPKKVIGKQEGRGRHQVMKAESRAGGDHTVFKVDANGKIKNYETYTKNPRNPSGFDSKKRVDLQGDSHFNKSTRERISVPHVQGKDVPGGVRPTRPDEIPKQ